MPLRTLVRRFYEEIWNEQRLDLVPEVLAPAVNFHGSLGSTRTGRDEFCEYVRDVTGALDNYRCTIESLVVENNTAAARLTFSGIHVATFLDRPPTGHRVTWAGAAFFHAGRSSRRCVIECHAVVAAGTPPPRPPQPKRDRPPPFG